MEGGDASPPSPVKAAAAIFKNRDEAPLLIMLSNNWQDAKQSSKTCCDAIRVDRRVTVSEIQGKGVVFEPTEPKRGSGKLAR